MYIASSMEKIANVAEIAGFHVKQINEIEASISLNGEYGIYEVLVYYFEEFDTINFSCDIGIDFLHADLATLKDAIIHINGKILIGHFDLFFESKLSSPRVIFSLSQPFTQDIEMSPEVIIKMFDVITLECNVFIPCFESIKNNEFSNIEKISDFALCPIGEA